MELAHKTVREHAAREMARQKRCHDRKLNWNEFKEGDNVLVFFPTRRPGQSPKFTSFWRGPFKIIRKYGTLTYVVNCGRGGRFQTIHVDRIRPCKTQTLRGEITPIEEGMFNETSESLDSTNYEGVVEPEEIEVPQKFTVEESEEPVSLRPRRDRKPPPWLRDYDTS